MYVFTKLQIRPFKCRAIAILAEGKNCLFCSRENIHSGLTIITKNELGLGRMITAIDISALNAPIVITDLITSTWRNTGLLEML